jgi:hypothetical protein
VQIIIALVMTPEGLPLTYDVLPSNTADKTTLRVFRKRIERPYGKALRVWLMVSRALPCARPPGGRPELGSHLLLLFSHPSR